MKLKIEKDDKIVDVLVKSSSRLKLVASDIFDNIKELKSMGKLEKFPTPSDVPSIYTGDLSPFIKEYGTIFKVYENVAFQEDFGIVMHEDLKVHVKKAVLVHELIHYLFDSDDEKLVQKKTIDYFKVLKSAVSDAPESFHRDEDELKDILEYLKESREVIKKFRPSED